MAVTTLAVASLAVGAYGAYSAKRASDRMYSLGSSQANRQAYYDNRLRELLDNPGSIFEDAGYKEAFRQGTEAVERSSAAGGFTGSGNAAIALQRFGQAFSTDYMRQQQQLLASLSGANVNPATAMTAGAQQESNAYSQLGNTLASLGYTMGGAGGGGKPNAGGETYGTSSVPGTITGTGGYIFNLPSSTSSTSQ